MQKLYIITMIKAIFKHISINLNKLFYLLIVSSIITGKLFIHCHLLIHRNLLIHRHLLIHRNLLIHGHLFIHLHNLISVIFVYSSTLVYFILRHLVTLLNHLIFKSRSYI